MILIHSNWNFQMTTLAAGSDSESVIKKMEYARSLKLNRFIIWNFGGTDEDLSRRIGEQLLPARNQRLLESYRQNLLISQFIQQVCELVVFILIYFIVGQIILRVDDYHAEFVFAESFIACLLEFRHCRSIFCFESHKLSRRFHIYRFPVSPERYFIPSCSSTFFLCFRISGFPGGMKVTTDCPPTLLQYAFPSFYFAGCFCFIHIFKFEYPVSGDME